MQEGDEIKIKSKIKRGTQKSEMHSPNPPRQAGCQAPHFALAQGRADFP